MHRLIPVLILLVSSAAAQAPGYEEAKAAFEEARDPVARLAAIVETHPDAAWPRHFHALALQESRRLDDARVALEHARRLEPNEPFHVKALAELAGLANDPERAARLFRTAERMESRTDVKKWLREQAEASENVLEDEAAGLSRARLAFWSVIAGALVGLWFLRPRR